MPEDSEFPNVSMPSEDELKKMPENVRQEKAKQASKAAASTQSMVESLRSKAATLTDPKKREKMLSEAYDREIEARGLSKKARVLESGTFQGAVAGGGFGAATGIGLGTAVGTLVGGVASVPTTAVGTLVGAGTGALHGPWIKLPIPGRKSKGEDGDDDAEEEQMVQLPQEAVDSGDVQIDDKSGEVKINNSEALQKAVPAASGLMSSDQNGSEQKGSDQKGSDEKVSDQKGSNQKGAEQKGTDKEGAGEKRKPKKLEIRSKKQDGADTHTKESNDSESSKQSDDKPRRKPPKLEVRSKKSE